MGDTNEVEQGSVVTTTDTAAVTTPGKSKAKKEATGNFIFDTAVMVQSLTKPQTLHKAAFLATSVEENYFVLGGLLDAINKNSWFDGHPDFKTFVFETYGFQDRKARYLIGIYNGLVTNQIPWDSVKHLGWTKLKDLAPILTLDNLEKWVNIAENSTVEELQAAIKGTTSTDDAAVSDSTKTQMQKVKLNFHPDQATDWQTAMAKGKGEIGTDFDEVVAANLASAYIGNTIAIPKAEVDVAAILTEMGITAAIDLFNKVFAGYELSLDEPESKVGEQATTAA